MLRSRVGLHVVLAFGLFLPHLGVAHALQPGAAPATSLPAALPPPGPLLASCSLTSLACQNYSSPAVRQGSGRAAAPVRRAAACPYLQDRFGPGGDDADAATVLNAVGAVTDFTAQASGDTIFIYSKTSSSNPSVAQQAALMQLETKVLTVARATPATTGPSVVIPIPHAAALGGPGNLAAFMQNLFPTLKATPVGYDRLLLRFSSDPDCDQLRESLEELARFAHHPASETPVATALYMDLAAVGAALNATPIPYAAGGANAPVPSTTPSPGPPATPAASAGGATAGAAPAKDDSAKAATAAGSDSADKTAAKSPPAAATPAAGLPAYSVNGKNLYFTDTTPGDDSSITERKRVLALLDLPQPQVLINAWVVQNSTGKAENAAAMTNLVHDLVDEYNNVLQNTVEKGWSEVAARTTQQNYFDPGFYNYITQRTIFDPRESSLASRSPSVQLLQEAYGPASTIDNRDPRHGICDLNQYCLGYQTLFRPVKPRLIDLLLTLIAANRPSFEADLAINAAESRTVSGVSYPGPNRPNSHLRGLVFGGKEAPHMQFCEDVDKELSLQMTEGSAPGMRMPLECFRAQMSLLTGTETDASAPSPLGGIRAAIADFLFNYKISQQYPHEFVPYDLTQSAQGMDAALAPIIEAFNQDLRAFEAFLHAQLDHEIGQRGLDKDRKDFLNGGILTVRTTSGDAASVTTETQSYLDSSKAPTPAQLINNILGAAPGKSSGAPAGVAGNLSLNEAQVIAGALKSFQETSVQVGRQLNLTVKPRSLTGALAAEMDIQLNAEDTPSTPTYWTPGPGGQGSAADLSRVSKHDVNTHVRVDSLRLFEVSSLTAILSKGRDRFPILPPFVELPYIGTLAGIPLRAAKEFHTSSAILSAVIVPTASDIAFSLRFVGDRVVVGHAEDNGTCVWPNLNGAQGAAAGRPCTVRKAESFADFAGQSIREYNRVKLFCIATSNGADNPTEANDLSHVDANHCGKLTFADTIHDEP